MDSKIKALAKFLDVKPELIKSNYGDYFTVNERIVKHGSTPADYRKLAENFRFILDTGMQGLISAALTSNSRKLKDSTYDEVAMSLVPLAERAKAWKIHRDSIRGGVGPVLTRKYQSEEVYLNLKEDNMYVENILFHLLKGDDSAHAVSLRKAWIGEPVDDLRKDATTDDGEYLVMDGLEAAIAEEESLSSAFQEMTSEVPDNMRKFLDEKKFIAEYSGHRGENLSTYDGLENSQKYDGKEYFIYRTN